MPDGRPPADAPDDARPRNRRTVANEDGLRSLGQQMHESAGAAGKRGAIADAGPPPPGPMAPHTAPLALVAMGTSRVGSPGFNDGFKGILVYLLVYTFMNLGAFAVITSLRQRNVIGDELDDMAGLYSRSPVAAVMMLLFLLSLAGIPPMAGFLGKYYIFLSLIESGHYVLATAAVLYALFGLYYYMKIANAMFMRQPLQAERLPVSLGMRVALGVTALATIVIGVFPEPFIHSVNWSLGIVQSPPVAAVVR